MNKIYTGLLSIALVLVVVAGTAFALFNDTVELSGMVLGTATPGLEFSLVNNGTPYQWVDALDFTTGPIPQPFVGPFIPGQPDWGEFFLRNTSTDNPNDPLNMSLTAQLIGTPTGHWTELRHVMQVKVCLYDESAPQNCGTEQTQWFTLNEWRSEAREIPGVLSSDKTPQRYSIVFRIPGDSGESVEGKQIQGVNWVITGSQSPAPTPAP